MGASDYMVGNAPGAMSYGAGNFAGQLFQMLSGVRDQYEKGQDFKYKQRQQDLFQSPENQNLLQDAIKTGNYAPLLQRLVQAGGASTAAGLVPQLMSQQAGSEVGNAITGGGGTPQQPNTSPTGQTPAALDKASARTGGANPRTPYTPVDQSGGVGQGNDNDGRNPTIRQMAIDSGVDPESPRFKQAFAGVGIDRELTNPNLAKATQDRISAFKSGGGSSQSPPPATNDPASAGQSPVSSAEANQGNEQTPVVGGQGGSQISPAPTAAAGGGAIQPSGPRVAQAPPMQTAQAPQAGTRPTPVGTEAQARQFDAQAQTLRAIAARISGLNPKAAEQADKQAAELKDRAKQIRESIGKYNEPTSEMKNQESGADERSAQMKADVKYYDTLHRGLAGSGHIAAQQKQNVDILRQVAASPNFIPGAGSDLALAYQRIAAQFGINPKGAAPREIFNQVAAKILQDQFAGMKTMSAETGEQGGRLFKSMLDIEEKANITSADSLDGVKAKLDIIDKTGDLMMGWADLADDYKIKHGRLDAGFDKALRADIAKGRVPKVVPQSGGAAGWKIERVP